MAIEIDVSRPLRRPGDLRELVTAVVAAEPVDEAHWVEWKSSLPLDSVEGWFSIARQILGFANRHPERAARFTGGVGYLIVGAEPGAVHGVTAVDVAVLDDRLRPYTGGDGPAWSATYLPIDGKDVLVVLVEAPQWGDRIYTFRKTYQPAKGAGAASGTVFVRREAKTERADHAEMDMLQDRLTRGRREPGLQLELDWTAAPVVVTPLDVGRDARQAWLDARRDVLLRPLRDHLQQQHRQQQGPSAAAEQLLAVERSIARMAGGPFGAVPEGRSPEQYRQEVEAHLQEVDGELAAVTADRLAGSGVNTLQLVARNPTDRNLPKVQLVLHIPGAVTAMDEDDIDEDPSDRLPPPPRRYGTSRPARDWSGLSLPEAQFRPAYGLPGTAVARTLDIDNSGSATLTFHLGDLRPRHEVTLEPVVLVVEEPPGGSITADWHATSTGADDVQEGTLHIPIAGRAVGPLDLIPADDPAGTIEHTATEPPATEPPAGAPADGGR